MSALMPPSITPGTVLEYNTFAVDVWQEKELTQTIIVCIKDALTDTMSRIFLPLHTKYPRPLQDVYGYNDNGSRG